MGRPLETAKVYFAYFQASGFGHLGRVSCSVVKSMCTRSNIESKSQLVHPIQPSPVQPNAKSTLLPRLLPVAPALLRGGEIAPGLVRGQAEISHFTSQLNHRPAKVNDHRYIIRRRALPKNKTTTLDAHKHAHAYKSYTVTESHSKAAAYV